MKKTWTGITAVYTNPRRSGCGKSTPPYFSILSCNPAELPCTLILFSLPLRRKSSAGGASDLFWRTTLGNHPGSATHKFAVGKTRVNLFAGTCVRLTSLGRRTRPSALLAILLSSTAVSNCTACVAPKQFVQQGCNVRHLERRREIIDGSLLLNSFSLHRIFAANSGDAHKLWRTQAGNTQAHRHPRVSVAPNNAL